MEERLAGPEQREASAYWRGALIHGEPSPRGWSAPAPPPPGSAPPGGAGCLASPRSSSRRPPPPCAAASPCCSPGHPGRRGPPAHGRRRSAPLERRRARDLDEGPSRRCVGCIIKACRSASSSRAAPRSPRCSSGCARPAWKRTSTGSSARAPCAARARTPRSRTFEVSAGEGHAEEGLAFQAGPLELRLEAFDARGDPPRGGRRLLFVTFPVGEGRAGAVHGLRRRGGGARGRGRPLCPVPPRGSICSSGPGPAGARTEESRS